MEDTNLSKVKGYEKLSPEWRKLFEATLAKHQQCYSSLGVPISVRLIKDGNWKVLRVNFENEYYKYSPAGCWY